MQMEATECGAASLAIVLAFHRIYRSLEQLREECGVTRDGTSAARIAHVARRYGFEVTGYRKEPEELAGLPLPAIIHWNFEHFVVLEGISRGKAWINDPARGRRSVTCDEFERSFTGPVLVFRRNDGYRPLGNPPRLLLALRGWLEGSQRPVLLVAFIGFLLIVPGIAVAKLTAVFVDRVLAAGRSELIAPLLAGMVLTAMCRGFLTWLQRIFLERLSGELVTRLSARYLRRALRLPFSFFLARHPGDVAARVELADRLGWLISGDLPATALAVMMVFFYGTLLVAWNPRLAMLGLLFAAFSAAAERLSSSSRAERAAQVAHEQARLLGLTMSGLQLMETLKANGAESRFFERWSGRQEKLLHAQHKLALNNECLSAVTRMFHALGMLAVLGAGAYQILEGKLTVGALVAIQSLLANVLGPFAELTRFANRLDEISAQIVRFQDVFGHQTKAHAERSPDRNEQKTRERINEGRKRVGQNGCVKFESVTFGYHRSQPPTVSELSFEAIPGSRIAIVGRTGGGKSTIARLLMGTFPAWSGRILLEGRQICKINSAERASRVASVEQEIHLFDGTIEENLTLWDKSIDREVLERAARDACIDECIKSLRGGFGARVAEGGRNFSGGERQRLEIARALARNPKVLVLDEATSALDPETEARLYERIKWRGCTCIIIAHRLSAIRDCDELLVLDNGRIVERGRHETLCRNANSHYLRLLRSES